MAIDWNSSMQQYFEYYIVNPNTWKDESKLNNVTKCTISRDSTVETLGSATIDITESTGECYIRSYLVAIQNGVSYRNPLGAFLVQTPSSDFDGKIRTVSMDSYTPLLELKENPPPLGYSIAKGENVMEFAYQIVREYARAPVVKTECDVTLHSDFVANTDDTWLSFLIDLIAYAKYEFGLDEMGRIIFMPTQKLESLQPVWTYNDDNSSILHADLSLEHDIYGIPNVVEVVYSDGTKYYTATAINDDENSPTSTVNRGRKIVYRDTNPSLSGNPSTKEIDEYAKNLLETVSKVEYKVSYTHGYCPVRLGDCVRLNYTRAGLKNVKAKVISQSISCTSGCQVNETAVFTVKLWG